MNDWTRRLEVAESRQTDQLGECQAADGPLKQTDANHFERV